jgi:thiol:disulfide interchange protein DsbA
MLRQNNCFHKSLHEGFSHMIQSLRRALIGFLLCSPLIAQADYFFEGVDYHRLETPIPVTTAPGEVEVLELFWYGCPHCFRLESHLAKWLPNAPAAMRFRQQPAVLSPRWAPAAQAFYTAEALGVLPQIHHALFDGIHVNGNRALASDRAAIAALFAQQGVSETDFNQAWESFAVRGKLRRAEQFTQRSGIQGVPTILVQGKYMTDGSSAGSYENLIKVIEYLVAKESGAAE